MSRTSTHLRLALLSRISRQVCILAGTLLLALPSLSAQSVDLTQKSIEDLMDVQVTSVSRKQQTTAQTAAAVFVISREDILRSGARNIPDLLRMVPGLDVAQIDSHNWAISARGFNGQYSDKLQVLIDGRTVYTPTFAGVYWDALDIPLDTIDRIEVIRGPGAAVWGANAVNGVINIITRNAADTQGVHIDLSGGNVAAGPETILYGGKLRGLGAFRLDAEGFNSNAQRTLLNSGGRDDWRLVHGGFRVDTALSARDTLLTEAEGYGGDGGEIATTPVSIDPPVTVALALRDRYSGWSALTRWTETWSPRSQFSLQLFADHTNRTDTTYGIGLTNYDVEFQQQFSWKSQQSIVWGLGYRRSADDSVSNLRISFDPEDLSTQLFSSFVQDEIAVVPHRLTFDIGARFEHNDFTGFDLLPSAGLVWSPSAHHMFWASVGNADRTPAHADTGIRIIYAAFPGPNHLPLLAGLLGNPQQKDEILTATEAGYRNTWNSRFSLDTTVFYNRYHDLVSVEPLPIRLETTPAPAHVFAPTIFGNGLYGETHGFEAFANWRVSTNWTLSPGYAFLAMHLHPFASSLDTTTAGATQGGAPDHQAQLRSTVTLPWRLQWDTSAFFVNRLPAQSIPSYTRLDSSLLWNASERFSFGVTGQNLLRALHPEYAGTDISVEPGSIRRDVYGKITWSF